MATWMDGTALPPTGGGVVRGSSRHRDNGGSGKMKMQYNKYLLCEGIPYFFTDITQTEDGFFTSTLCRVRSDCTIKEETVFTSANETRLLMQLEDMWRHKHAARGHRVETREQAKVILEMLGLDFSKDLSLPTAVQLEALGTLAKLTKFRRSHKAQVSLEVAFYNHLKGLDI